MMRFAPLIVFLLLTAIMGVALLSGGAPKPPDAMVGRTMPQTQIQELDAAALQKGIVVVNFFASWCAPCADEQPVLARLAADHADVRMVGIAYKDSAAEITSWLERHGNPFDLIGYDAQGAAAIDWGVYGVPETYVLVDGVIRHRHVGPLDDVMAARDIAPLLKGVP